MKEEELRFRAYDNRLCQWAMCDFEGELDEISYVSPQNYLLINTIYNGKSYSNGLQFTFMQSSYLYDNDGVEIYEGDILKEIGKERYYKVFKVRGGLVINTHQDDFYKPISKILFYEALADKQTSSFISSGCKVIGNIIDDNYLFEREYTTPSQTNI
jgi:hypothetical protein